MITSCAFAENTKYFATASSDASINLLDCNTYKVHKTVKDLHKGNFSSI
mgnify:CR=1 FL=1